MNYHRLASSGDDSLVMPGYSRHNITFCNTLKANGELVDITDERDTTGKKAVAKKIQVLGGGKPPGSGIKPCTLWDNMAYLIGFKVDDEKPERTRQTFEASRDQHLALIATGFGLFRIVSETHYVHESKRVNAWWQSKLGRKTSRQRTTQPMMSIRCHV